MKIEHYKELFSDFGSNIIFNCDLKKKIGSILEENLKYSLKQKI